MSLDEETVQESEEKRYHDEEHQRRQIAEDQHEHEPFLYGTGRIEALSTLRPAKAIAVVA